MAANEQMFASITNRSRSSQGRTLALQHQTAETIKFRMREKASGTIIVACSMDVETARPLDVFKK